MNEECKDCFRIVACKREGFVLCCDSKTPIEEYLENKERHARLGLEPMSVLYTHLII